MNNNQDNKPDKKSGKQAIMEFEWAYRAWGLILIGGGITVVSIIALFMEEITAGEGVGFSLLGALLFFVGWGMRRAK